MERIDPGLERPPLPLVTRTPENYSKQERKEKEEFSEDKKKKKQSKPVDDVGASDLTENIVESDSDTEPKGSRIDIQV